MGPLTACIVAPLALAAATSVAPPRAARWLALLGALLTLLVGGMAIADFAARPGADFRFVDSTPWSTAFGASFTFGVDGIGAAMLCLSGLITAIATIAAWQQDKWPRVYHALVLVLLAAMNGVFTSLDLLLFYVSWEMVLLPMLPLVGVFGGEQRRYAAMKFFVYTLAGSVLMLAMLIALWNATPREGRSVVVPHHVVAAHADASHGTLHGLPIDLGHDGPKQVHVPRGFDLRHLALQAEHWQGANFLGVTLAAFGFFAVLLACLVKIPAIPLHTWLPHAHVQAPTAVSVLLAGVLLKLGVYGLYRIGVPLFPQAAAAWAPALGGLGLAGILWGAWAALGQRDLKRLVAYSSVSHMGFCLLGLFSGTVAGATGGMVQAFTHGLSSGLLFLLVGVVYDRAHHRRVDGFGGLARPMPQFAWILLLGAMAGAGLPALAGFPGEFLVLGGAFTATGSFPWLGALATLSVVLSAAYLLWTLLRVAYGPLRHPEQAAFPDLDGRERLAAWPLAVLLVVVGLWPGPLVDALRPACELVVQTLQGGRP
ncbi:MAG: NADH-quinone oxidoreductase subunit M [Planctomycetes bacterium]|nr:NADH-quinone oxidoreductase subunit M [Planctomycetota bacterium]